MQVFQSSGKVAFFRQYDREQLFGVQERMTGVQSQRLDRTGFGNIRLPGLKIRQCIQIPALGGSFRIELGNMIRVVHYLLPVASLGGQSCQLFVRKYKLRIRRLCFRIRISGRLRI